MIIDVTSAATWTTQRRNRKRKGWRAGRRSADGSCSLLMLIDLSWLQRLREQLDGCIKWALHGRNMAGQPVLWCQLNPLTRPYVSDSIGFDLLCIGCTKCCIACCTTYPQLIEIMESEPIAVTNLSSCTWHHGVGLYVDHSCSARAERTLFLTESARTLTHFIMRTHFTFF